MNETQQLPASSVCNHSPAPGNVPIMARDPHRATVRGRLHPGAPLLVACLLLCAFCLSFEFQLAHAQQDAGSYTVAPGDTVSAIASRFGVSTEAIISANNLANPNLLRVGQVLLIPAASWNPELSTIATSAVAARPGDSLGRVASRYGLDSVLIASLNGLTTTSRLFPGQPILLPSASAPVAALRFGAITQIDAPSELAQGKTGRLSIESSRAISISATWLGLSLPLTALDVVTRQVALLPTPALLEPGAYTLTVGYTTNAGVHVEHVSTIAVVNGGYESQIIALSEERGVLLAPEIQQSELQTVTAAWSVVTPGMAWRTLFQRPIDAQAPTTSPFGTRRRYEGGGYGIDGYHAGQDFGAAVGAPILAPAAGIVALAAPLQVRGNVVILDHGQGVFSGFWHLSELRVTAGQVVNAGDVIGLVGNTGLSTGAHLHWELRIYGVAVDPMQFLGEPLLPPTP